MIQLEYINDIMYVVYFNKVELGCFIMQDDGYFQFTLSRKCSGYWSSYALRLVADKLDELNDQWHKQIEENIK